MVMLTRYIATSAVPSVLIVCYVHVGCVQEVHYNYSQCGCPMRVPYTQTFRPVLEL